MQVADLFRPPLGVLSVKCPSRANQASGLAGGFDLHPYQNTDIATVKSI